MSRPLWVVLLSDDPNTVHFFDQGVTLLGHHVAVVDSGARLLEFCGAVWADLVIADFTVETLQAVRHVCWSEPAAVVFLSRSLVPIDMLREFPMARVLTPPFCSSDLEAAVGLAVEHQFAPRPPLASPDRHGTCNVQPPQ